MADVALGAVVSLPCVAPYWISLWCCQIATTTNKYPQDSRLMSNVSEGPEDHFGQPNADQDSDRLITRPASRRCKIRFPLGATRLEADDMSLKHRDHAEVARLAFTRPPRTPCLGVQGTLVRLNSAQMLYLRWSIKF